MELFFGALNANELNKIKKYLSSLEIIQIDLLISEKAVGLIEKYSKSHHLQIPDSIIAATSLIYGMELLTYNVKDFKYIKHLRLYDYSMK
jgi:predicted nucleic acid-binding protein